MTNVMLGPIMLNRRIGNRLRAVTPCPPGWVPAQEEGYGFEVIYEGVPDRPRMFTRFSYALESWKHHLDENPNARGVNCTREWDVLMQQARETADRRRTTRHWIVGVDPVSGEDVRRVDVTEKDIDVIGNINSGLASKHGLAIMNVVTIRGEEVSRMQANTNEHEEVVQSSLGMGM